MRNNLKEKTKMIPEDSGEERMRYYVLSGLFALYMGAVVAGCLISDCGRKTPEQATTQIRATNNVQSTLEKSIIMQTDNLRRK